jgi:GxxExxY protein
MGFGDVLDEDLERIASQVVDALFRVHATFGPGLLETIYEQCLSLELESRGLKVQRQLLVPISYLGKTIEPGLRLDLLVEEKLIVECKAVETMNPVYLSQVKTYLKLANKRLGILVNFNVPLIKDGLKRVIL